VDRAHIARCRLRIKTRKRILAWMAPRKYGEPSVRRRGSLPFASFAEHPAPIGR
jgi:hypothetical protein